MLDRIKSMFSAPVKAPIEKKFFSTGMMSGDSYNGHRARMYPLRALEYYFHVAPLFTAINAIANEVGNLELALYDRNKDAYLIDHPLLDLVRFPNADCSASEFMNQLVCLYKITGNAFVVATGQPHKAPLELSIVNPASVEIMPGIDGYAEIIRVQPNPETSILFKRKEVDGRFRYYSDSAEIWHLRSFSPNYGRGDLWGMSDLNPIYLELEQYYEASIHNLSVLKRGARPSGAIKVDEMLTDDQFQRLQQQLEGFYSGSHNAGRSMILEGGDFVQMSQTNKDMDFALLKTGVQNSIYNALRIPLPLMAAEFSTYSNLEVAKLDFYDNAVLPAAKRILEELTVFLMPRYFKKDTHELTYNIDKVDALEPRRNQQMEALKIANVLTTNELRDRLGFPPIEGGDTLLVTNNSIPLASAAAVSTDMLHPAQGLSSSVSGDKPKKPRISERTPATKPPVPAAPKAP